MAEELLERSEFAEVLAPEESLVPPAPPEGLDTILYEHDERDSRADLRRQIAALELALARLFGSAFPRSGIDFSVSGLGGPRILSVDELERVRDGLAARVQDVRSRLNDVGYVEEKNRELIEEMLADPASHKWERVHNADIGEPGCKNWHVKPKWGPIGLLKGWWRVKISSGCPLAKGLRPPEDLNADEATAPQAAATATSASASPGASTADAAAACGPRRAPGGAVGKLSPDGDRDLHRARPARGRLLRHSAAGLRDDRRRPGDWLPGRARALDP
jgi:hypothetical protein